MEYGVVMSITINLVKDFSTEPSGRHTTNTYPNSGQRFRDEILAPAIREYNQVIVVLDGYNRYGRSFIDEAFGGLIRVCGFTHSELKQKLVCKHELIPSIVRLVEERIKNTLI